MLSASLGILQLEKPSIDDDRVHFGVNISERRSQDTLRVYDEGIAVRKSAHEGEFQGCAIRLHHTALAI